MHVHRRWQYERKPRCKNPSPAAAAGGAGGEASKVRQFWALTRKAETSMSQCTACSTFVNNMPKLLL